MVESTNKITKKDSTLKRRKTIVPIPIGVDHLNLEQNADIVGKKAVNETIVFSCEVKKKNRYTIW